MIIVDDGSCDERDIRNFVSKNRFKNLRIFKVKKDYGFNSHGCRNLIMKQATNDWVVLMDIDREFVEPGFAFNELKRMRLYKNCRYCFVAGVYNKDSLPSDNKNLLLSSLHQSVNDFLIHKDHFFSAGGYDEELIGIRNGDRQYFEQLLHFGTEKLIHGINLSLIRGSTISIVEKKLQLDISIKSKNDKDGFRTNLKKLIERRIKKPEPDKSILTFEWVEIE